MGTLWRSEQMLLGQLFLPIEGAFETVASLGDLSLIQFNDMNAEQNAFSRKYVNDVRRCDEMLRRLRYFESELKKTLIVMDMDVDINACPVPNQQDMAKLETDFQQLETSLKEIVANTEDLERQEIQLRELRHLLMTADTIFQESMSTFQARETVAYPGADLNAIEMQTGGSDREGDLRFVAGVVSRKRLGAFQRLLWRSCHGNVFVRTIPITEKLVDASGVETLKDVFILFLQGAQLETRVRKICDGFETTVYACPSDPQKRKDMISEVNRRLMELEKILISTKDHRLSNLARVAEKLYTWKAQVVKIKAVYFSLNMFEFESARRSLLATCWLPANRLSEIHEAIARGAAKSGTGAAPILNIIHNTRERPPTYNATNKYTSAFQSIVDAYGVANYQEVNPAPFTIITFPFLFAVMFGDLGHGIIMALTAGFLCYREESLAKLRGLGEVWETMFGGRYIILLMGLFSIYTGFIYNDVFSKSLTLGGSGWSIPPLPKTDEVDLHAHTDFRYAYGLGIDPIWALAENKLTFSNSYKMKMSIILGILQMGFGVVLSFCNHSYFGKNNRAVKLCIFFEFIPQMLFLLCIFGYLSSMIIHKWLQPWDVNSPPSLLLMLINMFLKFGTPPPVGEVLYGSADGMTQKNIQSFLVVTAVLCVPIMLFAKPFYLKSINKTRTVAISNDEEDQGHHEDDHGGHGDGHGGEFVFSEVMVHQAIHTIEFCLGCISNTASYLRLWALSLAHSQLSEVLWHMVLHAGFTGGWAKMFIAFAFWAVATVVVLLIMEGLSAFLHALRLHWVEFQNKFYGGQGILFAPFSLYAVAKAECDSEAS